MAISLQGMVCVVAAGLSITNPALSADKDANANKEKSAATETEKKAIESIRRLGGWVKTDKEGHVVEVNMVYHYTKEKERLENRNESPDALKIVSQFPHLKLLLLRGGQVTDKGLKHLRGLKRLERIYMWDAYKLSDSGVAYLTTLKELSYVHAGNEPDSHGPDVGLTDKSLKHFSEIKSLTGLSLQGNRFTDKGLKHLGELTQLTQLVVGLGRNKITDRGLIHLRGLKKLKRLGLQKTAITDEGLEELAELKNLEELWAGQTKITSEGVAELQKSIPKLKVTYDKPR